MSLKIGIRREDIDPWEKRVPLIPDDLAELVKKYPLRFTVQPSETRAFRDDLYRQAGAAVEESLADCPVVLALKEIPVEKIDPHKAYIFFSHTFKGQKHNMPMLRAIVEKGCTLIDYEKMVDENGPRILGFSENAGRAGMVDTLWALGRRLEHEGVKTPFQTIRQTNSYRDLKAVKEALTGLGTAIRQGGLSQQKDPMVFAFLGYGKVSTGAQEMFDILPYKEVRPAELQNLFEKDSAHDTLYKVVFREEDLVQRKDRQKAFNIEEFYAEPELYESVFENYVPWISVIVNGIFWTEKYPKYLTKTCLKELYSVSGNPHLKVVGDITCDVDGALECTVKDTSQGDPIYVYDPHKDKAIMGCAGQGPVVMAVYNLPAELPVDASTTFSGKLKTLIPDLLDVDFEKPFGESGLSPVLARATFVYRGEFTPDYRYLAEHI